MGFVCGAQKWESVTFADPAAAVCVRKHRRQLSIPHTQSQTIGFVSRQQKSPHACACGLYMWCREWESNPHSSRNGILSPARLPIPPSRLRFNIIAQFARLSKLVCLRCMHRSLNWQVRHLKRQKKKRYILVWEPICNVLCVDLRLRL